MTRLNLGCGDDRLDDWVNVDLRPNVADVICDARELWPWEDDEVDEIRAMDLLEHFPADQTNEILTEWARVLRQGGKLTLKVPNLYQICRNLTAYVELQNWPTVNSLIRNIYGGHKWGPEGSLDAHHYGFVPKTIEMALDEAGFDIISCDLALNMTVVGRKRGEAIGVQDGRSDLVSDSARQSSGP